MSEIIFQVDEGPDQRWHFYWRDLDDPRRELHYALFWDQKGFVNVPYRFFEDWITRPEPGDEFEVDGYQLVIVDMLARFCYDECRCMEASIAAHRLAQFHMIYHDQLFTWYKLIHA
jgi:hypothetical protein